RWDADRPQQAPERQALVWSSFGAAASVAAPCRGESADAAEEPSIPPRERTASGLRPENLLENPPGRAPRSPAGAAACPVVSGLAAIRAAPLAPRQGGRCPRQGQPAWNKRLRRGSKAATTARRRRYQFGPNDFAGSSSTA